MAYRSSKSDRPDEFASKASHSFIINDKTVNDFLCKCNLPKKVEEIKYDYASCLKLDFIEGNPIEHIITIDGGYSDIFIKEEFPSSKISFFQFGALTFDIADLNDISEKAFISPEDINKLKKIRRLKLIIPTKNITRKEESTLTDSVRKTLFEFFNQNPEGFKFIETLKWFIFEEYEDNVEKWNLSNCPSCHASNIPLIKDQIANYSFKCPYCNNKIYLTDVFRLHEVIDDEIGASGILGYVTTSLEQILLIHLIRILLKEDPDSLKKILFIKDGPLAFFGQTANMQKPMKKLVNFLFNNYELYLVGLEKSGPFVEHGEEISSKLLPSSALLLNNSYIYKYILLGKADPENPYGRSTYYGNKIIFKSSSERIYVVTLPTKETILNPKKDDFRNIDVLLYNIENLKCDMYENSLIPIALVNKLVSLSDHPSSFILKKFAKKKINQ